MGVSVARALVSFSGECLHHAASPVTLSGHKHLHGVRPLPASLPPRASRPGRRDVTVQAGGRAASLLPETVAGRGISGLI